MAQEKITKFSTNLTEEDDKGNVPTPEIKMSLGKIKKVMMDQPDKTSGIQSLTHLSSYDRMMLETQKILNYRAQMEIFEKIDNELVNVTPKPIKISYKTEGFQKLSRKYSTLPSVGDVGDTFSFKSTTSAIMKTKSSKIVGVRMSIEDIIAGIGSGRLILDLETSTRHSWNMPNLDSSSSSSLSVVEEPLEPKHKLPFIRVVLRKTELQLLYEQHSMTAMKNTEDGNFVEADNKEYDYLTIGRGKVRRRSEAEAQTYETLFKSRKINTIKKDTFDKASYVSYFEMYDTFKLLDIKEYESDWSEPKKLHISQSKTPEEQFHIIAQLPSFHLASVIMKRLLAGNIFEQGQKRFRNMTKVTRMVDKINYKYSLTPLFILNPDFQDHERKAVSDMSFCYTNSDILAVSYGIYSYQAAKQPTKGEVCVWSIKNPCDPERFYYYDLPVSTVEFSPFMPTLLAIGLHDGMVEVRDIAFYNEPPIAVSQRSFLLGVEPVLAIKWIQQSNSDDPQEIDPFLSLSQDGSTTQFRLINSPYLASFKQMTLERVEGEPEGLTSFSALNDTKQSSNRCPQGLNLTIHPVQSDIYYVLTDEGCIHKCSTNYQYHYLQVLKAHEGSVNVMDFSPWSPKLFVTCGNDWCIRVWMEGIFKPLITLKNHFAPYHWAAWSRVHSTILVAINRKNCEIWDLSRSILKPMSSTNITTSYNTMGIYSLDGNSIALGTERGVVYVNALDDMPFPPYYQYDALEKTIYKAVSNYPDLLKELKNLGYFGYPNKGYVKPP